MKLFQIKDTYLPDCYPTSVNKNGQLEYFIKGWKKTKRFKVVEGVELPDRWTELSWLEIAVLFDKYGIEVAKKFAERKTCGLMAAQKAYEYGLFYQSIKNIIPENFNPDFFSCLTAYYYMACFGMYLFDIVAFEEKLAALDKEYDHINCTWKGKSKVSLREYITGKYGAEYEKIIQTLINKK